MKAFFSRIFRPLADTEAATRRHLLWWILLRILLMSALCIIAAILRDRSTNAIVPPLPQTSLFLLALYLFSIASAFILQKTTPSGWKLRAFGLAQMWADAIFIAIFVYATGCSFSIFTPLFILPVIAAGLILYKTGSLALAAVSTLLYAAVLFLELSYPVPAYFMDTGYEPPAHFTATLNLFAFYGLLFFLAALISGQMGGRLHRAQQELRKTTRAYEHLAQLYQQIFDDITTGIITTDTTNRINSYNYAAELITGYSRDQVTGEVLEQIFPNITSGLSAHPARKACNFTKQNGDTIRIGYSSAPLRLPAEPGQNSEGSMAKVITLQDISQIERMEQQMREAEKLAAIGEMSAMIAHDFRNPLAAISGSAQMLAMSQDSSQEGSSATANTLVGIILRESERMEKTIADFLLFARPEAPQQEWFPLRSMLEAELARFLDENRRFSSTDIQLDVPPALSSWGDQKQIGAMLRQLVENACTAVQDSAAQVLIRAASRGKDENRDELILEVFDQGSGIPQELREQVFTPFFSHRAKGTGLGLAIVRQIAQLHDGEVTITEDANYRCIVRVSLPQPKQPLKLEN